MPVARKTVAAVAQLAQQFMDTRANLANAIAAIAQAARDGAEIIAFSECFLGQFPYWALSYDAAPGNFVKVTTALYETAIRIDGDECRALAAAARRHRIHVVMGCNELSDEPGSATIYNCQLLFDRDGELQGRHRKLMPTLNERMVHGMGDGRDLRVHPTSIGNVGMLICWEHHMTLVKAAMALLGEEIHVASWPGLWRPGDPARGERLMEAATADSPHTNVLVAISEYAMETGNFVLSAGNYFPPENISAEWRAAIGPSLNADFAVGGSAIVRPGGGFLAGPVVGREEILMAELDFTARHIAKSTFDPVGHYSRPDVLSLMLNAPQGRERGYVGHAAGTDWQPMPAPAPAAPPAAPTLGTRPVGPALLADGRPAEG